MAVATLSPCDKQRGQSRVTFRLPQELEASEPPEARGLSRDDVRLMVTYRSDNRILHTRFNSIGDLLREGDALVINTSGTLNAALPARRADGEGFMLHVSAQLPSGQWLVELRRPSTQATKPYFDGQEGEKLALPAGGAAELQMPYGRRRRLWFADVKIPQPLNTYLQRHGQPIRYSYVHEAWPSSFYQTVYATEKGSAEMPSAGRAFTAELITKIVARGVYIVPLILHTGVASLEADEPPYPEAYAVPAATARLINMARSAGGRIIAVGTTVVRALETVADESGTVHGGRGWTDLVIWPQRDLHVVDGLLTGWHEAQASHLAMLEALAGKEHVQMAYDAAVRARYLWHEFGDLHLLLP
jgi:S-adenosylmethionine:tRNA ribosyltransferase-isomerase